MSSRVKDGLVVLAIALFVLAAFAIGGSLSTLHQGEDTYFAGQLVVWTAYAAIVCAIAGALAAAFNPIVGSRLGVVACLAATPIAAFATFPTLWCVVMACNDKAAGWPIEPFGVVFPFLLALASFILARLARL